LQKRAYKIAGGGDKKKGKEVHKERTHPVGDGKAILERLVVPDAVLKHVGSHALAGIRHLARYDGA
jgi:hypothetical protein